MGQELLESNGAGADLLRQADEFFDGQLLPVMLEGPMDVLTQTKWTQPAIFVHSMALWREHQPDHGFFSVTAGHSLGEYGSLVVADVLSFEEALYLVKKRGELMQQAGENQPGTMAAVLGLDDEIVESICMRISRDNHHVVPANYNSTGQIVLSGHISAVHEAMELLQTEGAKMVKELTVGGAFHSPLMEPAREELASAIESTPFNAPKVPIYQNETATAVTELGTLKENLVAQLTAPVKWTQSVQKMWSDGIDQYVECGPGNVLQGLVKKIEREAEVSSVQL